jgi:hypothetical protein
MQRAGTHIPAPEASSASGMPPFRLNSYKLAAADNVPILSSVRYYKCLISRRVAMKGGRAAGHFLAPCPLTVEV